MNCPTWINGFRAGNRCFLRSSSGGRAGGRKPDRGRLGFKTLQLRSITPLNWVVHPIYREEPQVTVRLRFHYGRRELRRGWFTAQEYGTGGAAGRDGGIVGGGFGVGWLTMQRPAEAGWAFWEFRGSI